MLRPSYSRRIRLDNTTADTVLADRLTCAICGFPGLQPDMEPGEQVGAKPTTTTGSTYVWTNANDPLSVIDKQVTVVLQAGQCVFCHGQRYLDGARGSSMRTPA